MTSPLSPKRSFSEAGLDNGRATTTDTTTLDQQTLQGHNGPPTAAAGPSSSALPNLHHNAGGSIDSFGQAPLPFYGAKEAPNKKPKLDHDIPSIALDVKEPFNAGEAAVDNKETPKAVTKEEKIKLKEEKSRVREEKAKIREEKLKARQEVREKRNEEKQMKKDAKADERLKKEEEKNKKERAQLRLNSFFALPAGSTGSSHSSPTRERASPGVSRQSSVVPGNEVDPRSRSVSMTPSKPRLSDYKKLFPEFFLQSYTTIAPSNRFSKTRMVEPHDWMDQALGFADADADGNVRTTQLPDSRILWRKSRKTKHYHFVSMKEAIIKINGSASHPIDLTDGSKHSKTDPLGMLDAVPVKSLKFAEDVRPPYVGTYSKAPTKGSLKSLARRPFSRVRPDTNYDYDSEAEWEEPGEGEDLDSEGEEELDDDEEEGEMDGFLDDEDANDATRAARRKALGDLEPSCSGICWAGEASSTDGKPAPDFKGYRIDILLENPQFPIDPYSTSYWQPPEVPKSNGARQPTLMEPPRLPLHPVNRGNNFLGNQQSQMNLDGTSSPKGLLITQDGTVSKLSKGGMTSSKPAKRYISVDLMDEFKKAVEGSELTKMGLVEVLKKQFPKQPKDAIRDTLDAIAERVGEKNAEKKWVLKVI